MSRCGPLAEAEALRVCDELTDTINAHDLEGHVCTLNFPHIRIASGRVTIWKNLNELRATYLPLVGQPLEPGWHHSTMDEKNLIHSTPDKVQVAVQFTRWTDDGRRIATYQSLWIVTCVDGHLGRASTFEFCPIAATVGFGKFVRLILPAKEFSRGTRAMTLEQAIEYALAGEVD